tara:strand:- start:20267 stop:20860 length:594 start_codon:yes stop_codon:yes gene_type:complete
MRYEYTKVRDYSTNELLDRVKALPSFKGIPPGYWLLGVQSDEDTFNHFDDKFYLFKGGVFIMVTTGTTNAGTTGLMNYDKYNKNGVLVVKTDEWFHGLWKYGMHRGKMPALKQARPIKFFRDWNKNQAIEQVGDIREGIQGINFHTVTYQKNLSLIRKLIGGWSTGCQVVNNVREYYEILDMVKEQDYVTYCLIQEF